VSSPPDVAAKFIDMCKEAGWFATFQQVHLIYLSPEDGVSNLVAAMVNPPMMLVSLSDEWYLYQRVMTRESIVCLESLTWRAGCSIP
jgi:hypothetical protein